MKCSLGSRGPGEHDRKVLDRLVSAYYRSGLLLSPSWYQVAELLAEFDDIIIGVDTGILVDAVLSEQLLSALSLIDVKGYVHTPNWILLAIPSAVMHELEQAANSRDEKGYLTFSGRRGFRALQEILVLDQSLDIFGVSVTIVGEANPVLDTRVELRDLRDDFVKRTAPGQDDRLASPKLSAGDMIIRDQYKHFLKQIDFHKGVFFLTADKSNAALGKAEGSHSIYYKAPPWHLVKDTIEPARLEGRDGKSDVSVSVPIGKLLYELAVEFGDIGVRWQGNEVRFAYDTKGESLDHWTSRHLKLSHTSKLASHYQAVGKLHLVS